MTLPEYLKYSKKLTQPEMGVLLGKSIKDNELSPKEYTTLCNTLKENGFKFVNIEFQK